MTDQEKKNVVAFEVEYNITISIPEGAVKSGDVVVDNSESSSEEEDNDS